MYSQAKHQRINRAKINPACKYTSPEAMQKRIEEYFARQKAERRPITVTGIAHALDIERFQLNMYQNKDAFNALIRRAKRCVEEQCEERLYTATACPGTIFSLRNNFGWKDTQHVEVDSKHTVVTLIKTLDEKIDEYTDMLDVTEQIQELSITIPTADAKMLRQLDESGKGEKGKQDKIKAKKKTY